MHAGSGDDEAAIAAHIDTGAEHVAPGRHPDVARVQQEVLGAAPGPGHHGERQIAIQKLQIIQRLAARLARSLVHIDHDEAGRGAGDDANARIGVWPSNQTRI